jgi:hypothetical protein
MMAYKPSNTRNEMARGGCCVADCVKDNVDDDMTNFHFL